MVIYRFKSNDTVDKGLRVIKKKIDKEGIMKAAKAKRYYSKPSVQKREKSKAARKHAR